MADGIANRIEAAAQGGGLVQLLDRQRPAIEAALPRATGLTPERFSRMVLTELRRTPALAACEPVTILAGLMLGAQLGLEPGPLGHFWLVPFREKGTQVAQFLLGYRGMVTLAYRSRQVLSIVAREVREADEWAYSYGLEDHLRHRPAEGDRGALTHAYAVCVTRGNGRLLTVLSREDVAARRARSRAAESGKSPWQTDEAAMWRKSAVRALWPYLPLATDVARAEAADEAVATEIAPSVIDTLPAHGEAESGE